MHRRFKYFAKVVFTSILLAFSLFLIGCGAGLGRSSGSADQGGGGTTAKTGSLNSSVNHIVLFMQENRSFDQYFGQLDAYRGSK